MPANIKTTTSLISRSLNKHAQKFAPKQNKSAVIVTGQEWFISRAATLKDNNKIDYASSKGGVCFGVAHMAKQAILSGDLETFNQRQKLINEIPAAEFRQTTDAAKEKMLRIIADVKSLASPKTKMLATLLESLRKSGNLNEQNKLIQLSKTQQQDLDKAIQSEIQYRVKNTLSLKEQQIMDFKPFFDGVEMYEQAYKHPDYFENKPATQESAAPGKLVNSLALNTGSTSKMIACGQYNQKELQNYFQCMQNAIKDIQHPIAFVLDSADHSITIGYDPKTKRWSCIDPNMDPKLSRDKLGEAELANRVLSGFSSNGVTNFSTEISVAKENSASIKKITQSLQKQPTWQKIHKVTPEKAKTLDSHDGSLLYIAAQNGDRKLAKKLLKTGCPPDQPALDGSTPLFIAAQYGNLSIVKDLLKQNADPFKPDNSGATPITVAMETGRSEILSAYQTHFEATGQTDKLQKLESFLRETLAQTVHQDIQKQLQKVDSSHDDDQIKAHLSAGSPDMSPAELAQVVTAYNAMKDPASHKDEEQHQRGFETPEHLEIGKAIKIYNLNGTPNVNAKLRLYNVQDKNALSKEDYGEVTYSDLVALPDYLAISKGTIAQNPELFVTSFNKLDVKNIDELKRKIFAINDKTYVKNSDLNDVIQQVALVKEMGLSYYFTLTDNFDHFAPDSFLAYQAGHAKAMEMAKLAYETKATDPAQAEKYLQTAYALNAYAGHYLSDNFASGHARTPRRELADRFGGVIGGALANSMHNEDNKFGINVVDGMGNAWMALGDSSLDKNEGQTNKKHVVDTLQASADEVFAVANCGKIPDPAASVVNKMVPRAADDTSVLGKPYRPDETKQAMQPHQPLIKMDNSGKIFIRSELNDINCKKYHELTKWNVFPLMAYLRSPLYNPKMTMKQEVAPEVTQQVVATAAARVNK